MLNFLNKFNYKLNIALFKYTYIYSKKTKQKINGILQFVILYHSVGRNTAPGAHKYILYRSSTTLKLRHAAHLYIMYCDLNHLVR